MRRRSVLILATCAALVLGGTSSIGTAAARPPFSEGSHPDPHLVVQHTFDGRNQFLGSTDGRVLDPGTPGQAPALAARDHLKSVAPGLGVANPGRDLVAQQVLPLRDGSSVARYDQQIGGLPVFGGQVVLSLDAANGLTSVLSHVSAASSVGTASVPQADAEKTAVAATAKAEGVAVSALEAGPSELVVFDPALVDTTAVGPARPAWQVQVAGGPAIDELVLVDARSGGVLLHFNQVDSALSRRICDNSEAPQPPSATPAACTSSGTTLVRSEGDSASGSSDVDDAYDFLGETAQAYYDIAGIDLSSMIGVGGQLRATVNWCFQGYPCPYPNAFWSGTEMYFGHGYAVADDVVAHELTHGVTDHTAGLFYFAQSGAMNESFSDIFGEIVDHRFGPADEPLTWTIGEDLPGGPIRNMKNPGQFGDPAKMTSKRYVSSGDNDGVHTNSGVGNKTFYLISQGGTFNGVTMTGIDGVDPTLAKSALLYYNTLVSLTSGSEYADLGRVLVQQCGDLATAGTLGFTADDCVQVSKAVSATELAKSPLGKAAQPADPGIGCPVGTLQQVLFDGEASTANFSPGSWWVRAPDSASGVPSNETSAGGSWFGWDAPVAGASSLVGSVGVSLPAAQRSYLRFAQWRAYDYYGTHYYDGGTVGLKQQGATGFHRVDISKNHWVNGPQQFLFATGTKGFGGDSHGWVTSRLDLTPQAGTVVKPVFTTNTDSSVGYYGWYLDDVQIYTCRPVVPPTAVTGLSVTIGRSAGRADVTFSWSPPGDLGEGLTGYQVGGAGSTATLSGDATGFTFQGLRATKSYKLWVQPLGLHQALGPRTSFVVDPVIATISLAHPTVTTWQLPRLSGRLLTGGVDGRTFRVQYRYVGSRRWRALHWPGEGPAIVWSTDAKGRFWATYDRPARPIEIRVGFGTGPHGFAGFAPVVTQRLG